MQTALHIYSLVRELENRIVGSVFDGTEFYKKEREAYLHFKTGKAVFALGLVYHPHQFGCFLIPRGKVQVKTTEKPWPFFQAAYGGEVISVEQIEFDRIFRIDIKKGKDRFAIITEAIGPNGNFWLLDGEDRIMATLRNKKYDSSRAYKPPPSPDRLNPFEIDLRYLIEVFAQSGQTIENVLRKNITGLDKFLIREILDRSDIDTDQAASTIDYSTIEQITATIKNISRMFEDYSRGYSYVHSSGNVVYPLKLRTLGDDYERHKSLSFGIYNVIRIGKREQTEFTQKQAILNSLNRYLKRLNRKVGRIENDLQSAHNFEQYRMYAELLQINIASLKRGMDSIELEDIFSEAGGRVTVELNPALTPAQNADGYFKRYRKGKEALALLERRLEIAQKELTSAQEMFEAFEKDYDTAAKKYDVEIASILPKTAEKTRPFPRLPYREYVLSSGVTIYIGRGGSDNDTTTFRYAKAYELWFHASQCPGSHVVMKFPDKNFAPSKTEIVEAASVTAYHSKARNSRTVPVIYTQRKYVRKPRRAKPGLVTVQREKMIMVEPKKPE